VDEGFVGVACGVDCTGYRVIGFSGYRGVFMNSTSVVLDGLFEELEDGGEADLVVAVGPVPVEGGEGGAGDF